MLSGLAKARIGSGLKYGWKLLSTAAILLVSVPSYGYYSVPSVSYYAVQNILESSMHADEALQLDSYRQLGEPIELTGIEKDASGLTYNPDSQTLMAVINHPPQLLELSLDGDVLRKIPMEGFNDPEGIAYLGNNRYAVIEERDAEVLFFSINSRTSEIFRDELRSVVLPMAQDGNKGLEGVAVDLVRGHLYLVKEKFPRKIYRIEGFLDEGQPLKFSQPWTIEPTEYFQKDLSGLHFDQRSGNLLVLSDESKMVVEISSEGIDQGYLPLREGFAGLGENVPQAEGVTMDDRGRIYILSEPNRLYRFEPAVDTVSELVSVSACVGCKNGLVIR